MGSVTRRQFISSSALAFAGCILYRDGESTVRPDISSRVFEADRSNVASNDIPSRAMSIDELADAFDLSVPQRMISDEERLALNYLLESFPTFWQAPTSDELLLDIVGAAKTSYGTYIDALIHPWRNIPSGLVSQKWLSDGPYHLPAQFGYDYRLYSLPEVGDYRCRREYSREYAVSLKKDVEEEVLYKTCDYQYGDDGRLTCYDMHPDPMSIPNPVENWHCTYDERGFRTEVVEALGYRISGGGDRIYYDVSRTKMEYDDEGHVTRMLEESMQDSPSPYSLDEPDANRTIDCSWIYSPEGYILAASEWKSYSRNEEDMIYWRVFDKKGRPVRLEKHKGSKVMDGYVGIDFDDYNRPIAWRGYDGENLTARELEYDNKGRITRSFVEETGETKVITYVEDYHLTIEERVVGNKTIGVCVIQYDSAGRFAYMHTDYRDYASQIVLRDAQGHPLCVESWASEDGSYKLVERITYTYDAKSGLLSKAAKASTRPKATVTEGMQSNLGLGQIDYYKIGYAYEYFNASTGEIGASAHVEDGVNLSLDEDELLCPAPDTWPTQGVFEKWNPKDLPFEESLAFADSLSQ